MVIQIAEGLTEHIQHKIPKGLEEITCNRVENDVRDYAELRKFEVLEQPERDLNKHHR